MRINLAYYTGPLAIPVTTTEAAVIEGHKAFKQLWNVQQKFNRLTNEYQDFYDNLLLREQLTQSDIDYTIETANWVNLYQYETLSILLDQNSVLRVYSNYLMTTKEWKDLSRDQRTFATKLTDNIEKIAQSLRSLELIEVENPEEMVELNLEKAKNDLRKGIKKQIKHIRYPI